MKQKIVIKVQMNCEKCRSKAMKTAAVADGVTKVEMQGAEKDELMVIGEGVDAVKLTCSLRKELRYATLLSVQEEKDKEEPKEDKPTPTPTPSITPISELPSTISYDYQFPTTHQVLVYDWYEQQPSAAGVCLIM